MLLAVALLVVGITSTLISRDAAPPTHPQHLDVRTTGGRLRGQLNYTLFERRPFYAFKGVPYAEPPLGQLGRFQPPRPIAWAPGVRECIDHGPVCMQATATGAIVGSEDCLRLNVYTPADAPAAPLPVMVYMFGSAWYRRSADSALLGPDFLIDQHVVLVTLNYRLGVFGFLAVDAVPAASGNWGLKDQQLALQWVQHNIGAFGGDAARVTLFGQSSGGMAGQLHQMADGSQGLFHRTIQMSTSFDGRATFRPRSAELQPELRRFVGALDAGVDTANGTALLAALRDVDAERLMRNFPFVQFHTPIMPTVESSLAPAPFMHGDPAHLALERPFAMDMPVLTGCTSNEAISMAGPEQLAAFQRQPRVDIPSVYFAGDWTSLRYRRASERIFARYFPHGGAANATVGELVRLQGDVYQSYPADRKVRALARWNRGPTWFYQFDLDTRLNAIKRWSASAEGRSLPGASHFDDVCYVFCCAGEHVGMYDGLAADSAERRAIGQMAGLFGRFARGESMGWPAVEPAPAATVYMHMGPEGFAVRTNAMGDRRRFWDGVVRQFGYGEL